MVTDAELQVLLDRLGGKLSGAQFPSFRRATKLTKLEPASCSARSTSSRDLR